MEEWTRRGVLSAAAGATLATTLPLPSFAAMPMAGKQAAGFYRYKVGSFEVTVVTDGMGRFKVPEDFVGNVKRDEVVAALIEAHIGPDMATPYNPIVINTGSRLALFDTGTGEAALTASRGLTGHLLGSLAAAGIEPSAIDTVVVSHYHGDHVNGLLRADGSLAFPNAEILVPAVEHKYWTDDGEMSRAPKGRIADLFKNNRRVFGGEALKRLRTYEWDKEVLPGILAVGTPGHTPGHTSYVVSSGGSKLYVQADVTHVPFLFVRHPGWHAFYDQDPVMAEATRRKVYDMLAAERMMVQGFHYPFPAQAHVEKTASGYQEIPVPWSPTI